MKCPFCGNEDTQVKDSRSTEDNSAIRRRRFCLDCGARFTTFERIQLRELTVVKKNGRKSPFDREKLAKSLLETMAIEGQRKIIVFFERIASIDDLLGSIEITHEEKTAFLPSSKIIVFFCHSAQSLEASSNFLYN